MEKNIDILVGLLDSSCSTVYGRLYTALRISIRAVGPQQPLIPSQTRTEDVDLILAQIAGYASIKCPTFVDLGAESDQHLL